MLIGQSAIAHQELVSLLDVPQGLKHDEGLIIYGVVVGHCADVGPLLFVI